MRRSFMGAVLSAVLLSGSLAQAEIPAVVAGTPGNGSSPGTGQTGPAAVPDPVGLPGNPQHPNPNVGNKPPLPWFQNSFYPEVVALQNAANELYAWAYYNDPYSNMGYYASWLYSVMKSIRNVTYFSGYEPIFYPAWSHYVTRGDLLYYNYWWVRPLYFQILREGAVYNANTYPGEPGRQDYLLKLIALKNAYHRFVICIHGRNGDDAEAADDTETVAFENDAGV